MGLRLTHKRVYRIYSEIKLNLRINPQKRLKRDSPEPLSEPNTPNDAWSMDCMKDQLVAGRSIRTLTVLDDINCEPLGIDVDLLFPAERVRRRLNQIIEWRGKPKAIRVENSPEYTSGTRASWADTQSERLKHNKARDPKIQCIHRTLQPHSSPRMARPIHR